MISRIEQIKALLRKASLKSIVRAGRTVEDEANTAYDEPEAPSLESSDSEGIENLEQMFGDKKKKRNPDVRYNLKDKDQREVLKEKLMKDREDKRSRQNRIEEIKQLRETSVPYNMDMAIAKYQKLQKELALPFNPSSPMFKQNIKIEMQGLLEQFPELAETIQRMDETDKEFDLANPEFADMETDSEPKATDEDDETKEALTEEEKKEKQMFSEYKELINTLNSKKTSPEDKQIAQESLSSILAGSEKISRHYELVKELAKYGEEMTNLELEGSKIDTAMRNAIAKGQDVSALQDQLDEVDTKTEKLQSVRDPLQKELMGLIQSMEGRRNTTYDFGKDKESEKFSLDDVLIMANDTFSFDEAKKNSNGASPEDLKNTIKEKMKELGMSGKKEEKLEAVEAYFFGKTTTAEEEETEEKGKRGRKSTTYEDIKELPFHEVPEDWMKKLTVDQKLEMADYVELYAWNKYLDKLLKQRETEAPVSKEEETARAIENLEQNFGAKEKPQHSGIKRINPETGEVTYISIEDWEAMVKERQAKKKKEKAEEIEKLRAANASAQRLSIRESNFFDKQVEELVCSTCHNKNNQCTCPGGPAMAVNKQASDSNSVRKAAEDSMVNVIECPQCNYTTNQKGDLAKHKAEKHSK